MTNKIRSTIQHVLSPLFSKAIQDEELRYRLKATLLERSYILDWLTDPILRNHRSRLQALQNSYSGQRCFIMGNGPSLNKTPLENLKDEWVWGANRCNLLFDRITWRPALYIAIDERVVPDNAREIADLFGELQDTKFFFPVRFRLSGDLPSHQNIYWYRQRELDDGNLPDGHFSTKIPDYVRSARTVTIAALQLAVFLGFNPIYLIGCDTNYSVSNSAQFEGQNQDLIIGTADDDPNHFSPDYFGKGKKYHQPYPERMIFGYQQAKSVCDRLDIQVYNATVGGKLEVFPRVNIWDIVG